VPKPKLVALPFWSTISEYKVKEPTTVYEKNSHIIKIGCPGRMVSHKNHKVVIEALSELKQTNRFNFHLYLAGTGATLTSLEQLTGALHLEDNVSFLGHLSEHEMIHFYKQMDVVILPSLHE